MQKVKNKYWNECMWQVFKKCDMVVFKWDIKPGIMCNLDLEQVLKIKVTVQRC